MTIARHRAALRRLVVATLTILCLAGSAFAVLSTSAAQADVSTTYDGSIGQSDCELLGRAFNRDRGCSRTACADGLVAFRRTFGAEACALRGQPSGYGTVSTVDVRRCKALNRRWIPQVNYCATNPDRSVTAVYGAAQCQGAATVYVNLTEEEGYYDECLTPERADELVRQAAADGSTLPTETSLRSSVQCPYRPGYVFTAGRCVFDPASRPVGGGVLMIGDSLTWRGSDELARLRPSFTIDGEPARPLSALQERLDHFRAGPGEPEGLIIELGASPAKSFGRRELARIVRSLSSTTDVMLVLPYYQLGTNPVVVSKPSVQAAGWMKSLARSRKNTCVADWPAYVRAHSGILQDGVHTRHASEGRWANWISQQWSKC
jgi:hypothetical protein